MSNICDKVVCVQGATASGKSELAERVAAILGGEIISADSMQIYRGMDIGTAKVPASERAVAYSLHRHSRSRRTLFRRPISA